MKKSRTAALALAALMLCAVLSACGGDTQPSAEIVGGLDGGNGRTGFAHLGQLADGQGHDSL